MSVSIYRHAINTKAQFIFQSVCLGNTVAVTVAFSSTSHYFTRVTICEELNGGRPLVTPQ